MESVVPSLRFALRPGPSLPPDCLYIENSAPFFSKDSDDFATKLRIFLDDLKHYKYLNHLEFIPLNSGSSAEKTREAKYMQILERVRHEIWLSMGSSEDSLLGLHNLFQNLDFVVKYPGLHELRVEKPFHAVIIATGPSLDLEMDRLKHIQSNALLISVDASLKTLLDAGIEPHIVVALERDDYSVPFFQNLPKNLKTLFVGQPTVSRKIFEAYPGPCATVKKFSGPFLWLPTFGVELWSGSSAAHLSYRIACYLGAESVALVGQDLAYHPDTFQSHSHVKDYPEWRNPTTLEERKRTNQGFWTEGNTREQVLTMPFWDLFANEYSLMVRETKTPTFNTSTLGRKIAGISYQPLEIWARRLHRSLTFSFPLTNSTAAEDRLKLEAKIADAVLKLSHLITKLDRRELALTLYDELFKYPHFLELVFENVVRDFAETENLSLGCSQEKTLELKQAYLQKVKTATKRVVTELKTSRL